MTIETTIETRIESDPSMEKARKKSLKTMGRGKMGPVRALARGLRNPLKSVQPVGEGGFASVYRGRDGNDKDYIMKVLTIDHKLVDDWLRREAYLLQVASEVTDVPKLHAAGRDKQTGLHYMVMDRINGVDLRDCIEMIYDEEGGVELGGALDIGVWFADALGRLHDAKIYHGDLKPANLIIGQYESAMVDFSLGRTEGMSQVAEEDRITGTTGYIAPEIYAGGEIDAKSDQFAFGMILQELLTGYTPERVSGRAGLFDEDKSDANYLDIYDNYSPRLADIVAKCRSINPDRRFNHMEEVAEELDALY